MAGKKLNNNLEKFLKGFILVVLMVVAFKFIILIPSADPASENKNISENQATSDNFSINENSTEYTFNNSLEADQIELSQGFVSRTDFVNCLKESGLIMYGVNTCEYCQQQKTMFGSQFDQINYINCQFDQEICQAKGINNYPVWEYQNQHRAGIQTFRQLANFTGCPMPTE